MIEKLRHYAKGFGRATEHAFMDEKMEKMRVVEHLETLFGQKRSKFDRAIAMMSLLRKILPADVTKFKYKTENLPFNPDRYELKKPIGRGGESDAYLLESKEEGEPSWALKINHQDRGDPDDLSARAWEIRQKYEIVRELYKGIEGLVPQEWTVILEGFKNGKPAIATIQKYYGKEIRDVFKDVKEEEMARILSQNPNLKQNFSQFLRISREQLEKRGEIVDLIGDGNLSLVKGDGREELILLDPHLISDPFRTEEKIKNQQRERLVYLERLDGMVDAEAEEKMVA